MSTDKKIYASTGYVDKAIAAMVDSAPETLNTLNELAAALGDDPNFATTVSNQIGNKVDKTTTVNGKALSSNITLSASDVGADSAGTAEAKVNALNIKNGNGIGSLCSKMANNANGQNAIAFGSAASASGDNSIAIGLGAEAAQEAVSIGYKGKAIGKESLTIGKNLKEHGRLGIALGVNNYTEHGTGYFLSTNSWYPRSTFIKTTTYLVLSEAPTPDLENGVFIYGETTEVLGADLKVGDLIKYSHSTGYYELLELVDTDDNAQYFKVGIREIGNYANEYGTNLLTIGSGRYSTPQNAMTLDWYGNARFDGDVYVQGTGTTNMSDAKRVATEEFVISKGYLTSIPASYVTESELNAKGYLTSIPAEYITESELNTKGYLTSIPAEYITETELTAKDYATESYVDTAVSNINISSITAARINEICGTNIQLAEEVTY